MPRELEIKVLPGDVERTDAHRVELARQLGVPANRITAARLQRRSIDARGRQVFFLLRYLVWVDEQPEEDVRWELPQRHVADAAPVIVIGFGPAGMFAAMRLIELGLKPVVLERGKPVRERRRDLAALNKAGQVNPESNYCFGEGGAGTFSDGKLYTRSSKRGDVRRILEILVRHGAVEDILIDAHPHIGTNKLPQIIQAMRETIIACGGEVHFDTRVDGLRIESGQFKGVVLHDGRKVDARAAILGTGHSARDIFRMVQDAGLLIEAKPFALGLRVEHPQALIDETRYRVNPRPDTLPAASYALVEQVHQRGVYSFCMCPGGIICPAATADDEVVVNGWSPSKRDSPFANSGIVVEVKPEDLEPFAHLGALAGVAFQSSVERQAYTVGGGKQVAPAQRLGDFVRGKRSQNLPECSYLPGLKPVELGDVLPPAIHLRLRDGFKVFDKKIRGYLSNEAVVVATESRTSSPVRIPRDAQTRMHPQADGLFPCGEGAGFAGGIMSAAMDGERSAEAAALFLGIPLPD